MNTGKSRKKEEKGRNKIRQINLNPILSVITLNINRLHLLQVMTEEDPTYLQIAVSSPRYNVRSS